MYVTGVPPVTINLKGVNGMRSAVKRITRYLEYTALVFLLMVFACVLIQIIMRNFFNSGSVIMEELARFSLVSLVFLMIPVLVIDKGHIIVDILVARLPKRVRRIFEIIIQSFSFGLALFLLAAIKQVMDKNWSVRTPAMKMPNSIYYIPIIIGIVFMAVGACIDLVEAIKDTEGTL